MPGPPAVHSCENCSNSLTGNTQRPASHNLQYVCRELAGLMSLHNGHALDLQDLPSWLMRYDDNGLINGPRHLACISGVPSV